jgi:hypothetical protein
MRRVLVTTAYVVLGMAALALVVLNVLAWTGSLVEDPPAPSSRTDREPGAATRPPPTPKPQPVSRLPTTPPAAPATTTLTISATRGDCWVEVRVGSTTGQVLYAGTLAAGSTIRFNRKRLWLRLGAASNVDIVVNGRESSVPPGTVELVLPA